MPGLAEVSVNNPVMFSFQVASVSAVRQFSGIKGGNSSIRLLGRYDLTAGGDLHETRKGAVVGMNVAVNEKPGCFSIKQAGSVFSDMIKT